MTHDVSATPELPTVASCDCTVVHEPQAVLAAALEAYVAIDATGRVVAWNPAAERTFGYSHAQACGRQVGELIIPGGTGRRTVPVSRG